jgi:hypothetical protein
MSPPVFRLAIHLPNQQPVTYDSMLPQDEVILAIDRQRSTLMAFFEYNTEHPESPPCLYQDFPLFFTWDAGRRHWKPRVRKQTQIGRGGSAIPSKEISISSDTC